MPYTPLDLTNPLVGGLCKPDIIRFPLSEPGFIGLPGLGYAQLNGFSQDEKNADQAGTHRH
jgi:hypothetical protein